MKLMTMTNIFVFRKVSIKPCFIPSINMITKTWQQRHWSEIGDINVETETVELSS